MARWLIVLAVLGLATPAGAQVFKPKGKKSEVIELMRRKQGVTLDEIMKATGWQAHTVRGFISIAGSKLGLKIESFRTDDKVRIAELEREVKELRRANEILKSASAFFARELDPRPTK